MRLPLLHPLGTMSHRVSEKGLKETKTLVRLKEKTCRWSIGTTVAASKSSTFVRQVNVLSTWIRTLPTFLDEAFQPEKFNQNIRISHR